ncbi:MAG: Methylglyoxal synthase [Chroococcidiopsis cubana SAG 39.79]|uniref:FHA domain-containing protein n=1 Tax=Chroococcidiopsis cubana SAG 39.79 TaxID=388085 RepID=A0AB37UIK3_9CYAN|nr:FHA domain-containing protein [Chroococcidiopsis cubana]MDZ4877448.1 Methylglyoxal synthase [Chroococcidiopsis cubana SAG 39.79]PSB65828.1 hypothetical protein C7B79_03685 [Chroococcidiopsis cubana CCALA 043]RUT11214.1 hypothetical protein DSM107010_34830 [Chroococcidiopsis cubana SAG 39.79]
MKLQIINAQTHEEFDFDLVSVIRHQGKCMVGRSATSNLLLEQSDISRCHGEFSYQNGEYYFTDIGSTNGCLINNKIATKKHAYLLKAGDEIRLGDFLLKPLTGIYEDATVVAPIASLSNGAESGNSEISSEPEIAHEIPQIPPVDESTSEELPAAKVAAQPEGVEQSNIDDIALEQSIENAPAKDTETIEASTSPEVTAESGMTQLSDAIVTNSKVKSSADDSLDEPNEDISAKVTDATTLQESVLPSATVQSNTADIPSVIAETPKLPEEPHTDTTVAQMIVEENATPIAEKLVLMEVAQASVVGESSHSSIPDASTSTEHVEAQAAEIAENPPISTDAPELIDTESTNATVSPTNEATDEELGDRDRVSAVSEILKEKYIVLLAHDSQKAELVDFILRHQETFSKCLLMASSNISEVLDENNIFVRRVLSNLTAGGYQEVNSLIASKNLLGVIFLRDFLAQQPSQANDEALSRACNVNPVVLATNIATAQAFEGYLQHLIASTSK